MTKSNEDFDFPANYDWVSSRANQFRPREADEEIMLRQADLLLRTDKGFQHLLRRCKDKWYVAVTLGRDNVRIAIYLPSDVDNPQNKLSSSTVNKERSSVLMVSRGGGMASISKDKILQVIHTPAYLYASRTLRASEILALDSLTAEIPCEEELVD